MVKDVIFGSGSNGGEYAYYVASSEQDPKLHVCLVPEHCQSFLGVFPPPPPGYSTEHQDFGSILPGRESFIEVAPVFKKK